MNEKYKEYLLSYEWEQKRQACFEAAGYRCQLCYSDGPLHAHHRTYKRLYNEHPNDLTALCSRCHKLFHKGKIPKEVQGKKKKKATAKQILKGKQLVPNKRYTQKQLRMSDIDQYTQENLTKDGFLKRDKSSKPTRWYWDGTV